MKLRPDLRQFIESVFRELVALSAVPATAEILDSVTNDGSRGYLVWTETDIPHRLSFFVGARTPGRVAVSAPADPQLYPFVGQDDPFPRATFALTRPAAAVALALQRRVLPVLRANLHEWVARRCEWRNNEASRKQRFTRLAEAFAGAAALNTGGTGRIERVDVALPSLEFTARIEEAYGERFTWTFTASATASFALAAAVAQLGKQPPFSS
jgi:hypothetical protein